MRELKCLNNFSFKGEVVKKRKEALKEETELGRIQAKRYLDFLDILLFARVRYGILILTLDFPFFSHSLLVRTMLQTF